MPKFSAYMRGEEGPKGASGQAAIYDGYVSSSTDLPIIDTNDRNYTYYVDEEDGIHLYIYTTTEPYWKDLGTLKGDKGDTGDPAEFTSITASIDRLPWSSEPTINISTSGPNTSKNIEFNFKIPTGRPAGFNPTQNISVEQLDYTESATASINVDNTSPEYNKVFNFNFGIPRGEPGDFGEPTISISTVDPFEPAHASITSRGGSTTKIFDFHFDIPQGHKGDKGDAFAIYETITFSSTDTEYWDNNRLLIERGNNKKIPLYIKNEDDNSLIRDYNFDDDYIYYDATQPFDGTIFCATSTERGTIQINSTQTVPYGEGSSVIANEKSTSTDLYLDFILERGQEAGFGEPWVSVSTVSSDTPASATVESEGPDAEKIFKFHFNIPQGSSGVYSKLDFTTEDERWNGNILEIDRGLSDIIPIYVKNNDNNSIAATFKVTDNKISFIADEKFNGTMYFIGKAFFPNIIIGDVTPLDFDENPTVELNPSSDLDNVILDFGIPRGQNAIIAKAGEVFSLNPNANPTLEITKDTISESTFIFNFGIPKGEKGDKGEDGKEFTVEVDPDINVLLEQNAKATVDTTTTPNGIKLKFNLPPSIVSSTSLGLISNLNTIDLENDDYIEGILPIKYGGTGNNIGEAEKAKQLSTSRNFQVKLDSNSVASFNGSNNAILGVTGTLPIEHGGTSVTTLRDLHNILFNNNYTENNTAKQITAMSDFGNGGYITLPLPVSYGGIGTSTADANLVFATPNGTNGTPSFRALVQNDIPSLNTSKITDGVLPQERGGTGSATVQPNLIFAGPNTGNNAKPTFRLLTANDIPTSLGNMTFTGTVIMSKTTDAQGTSNEKPALIVGGTDIQAHLELDCNEIMSKASATTTASLYINSQGGSVNIGSGGLKINNGVLITKVSIGTADVSSSLPTGNIYLQYE